ncbi:HDOD domain-containing protein [Azovibrio restrictus]|uniref:HDOD domain-containing protein n=1 Tax=Azovibrio restrictus TaxID=146938 RepID=UPI0026EFAC02|nr:HDOD domain-containing protein [Azovibrio restrictus]
MSVPLSEILASLAPDEAARLRFVLDRGVKIPPQPRVLEELRRLLNRREFDVRALARIITQDPGVTALLFKAVKSVAYRQHHPFESVEQIIHALGVKETFNLVQAVVLTSATEIKANRLAYESFWARSQAVAQLAMLIADDRVSVCNIFPDQAYLAGMFHDCGVPVLMQRFSTYCKEMHLGDAGRWVDLQEEDRKFNLDHCAVGYLVARHWSLPAFICDAVRCHHDIAGMGMHASRTMVAILQLAMELHCREQRVENPEWLQIQGDVLAELGLHDDALPEFADEILERFHEQPDAMV